MSIAAQLAPAPLLTQFGDEITPKLPLIGGLTIERVRLVLSMSLAVNVILTDTSSSVVTTVLFATGGSFTALIAIDTLATFESKLPSFTLNVKLSEPL
jgi:hypothetical protein